MAIAAVDVTELQELFCQKYRLGLYEKSLIKENFKRNTKKFSSSSLPAIIILI